MADGLLRHGDDPEQWETAPEALGRSRETPNAAFFVRSHMSMPRVDPVAWRLEVAGHVERPLALALDDLATMPQVEDVVTVECAGNGRALFDIDPPSGVPWRHGAVGTARWSGVRLSTVLAAAAPTAQAAHVWLECLDRPRRAGEPLFSRSIPLVKAMDDVLLATRMNGEPLPVRHGFPLRAIVPGWFGMASAKWVACVRLEAAASDSPYMVRSYRYDTPGATPGPPVETMLPKSWIASPREGERVMRDGDGAARGFRVSGFAWAGPAGVAAVDLSYDGGATWSAAALGPGAGPSAWRPFEVRLAARPGRAVLMSRARDGNGVQQPESAPVNCGGYGNNSIHRIAIEIEI